MNPNDKISIVKRERPKVVDTVCDTVFEARVNLVTRCTLGAGFLLQGCKKQCRVTWGHLFDVCVDRVAWRLKLVFVRVVPTGLPFY